MSKAKCKLCNDTIESLFRHDFVTCSCGKVSIDGGKDYTRILGSPEDYEFIHTGASDEDKELIEVIVELIDNGRVLELLPDDTAVRIIEAVRVFDDKQEGF